MVDKSYMIGNDFNKKSPNHFCETYDNKLCMFLSQDVICIIDKEDYPIISKYRWFAARINNRWIAMAHDKENPKCKLYMHRLLCQANKLVDHKHHYDLESKIIDHTKINLRGCNRSQNGANSRKYVNSSSKYKGVFKDILSSGNIYWKVSIGFNNKNIHVGRFPFTPEGEMEAARAYDKKAKELYGQFAKLNFSEPIHA